MINANVKSEALRFFENVGTGERTTVAHLKLSAEATATHIPDSPFTAEKRTLAAYAPE